MSANASLTIVGGPQRIEPGRETTLTAQIINLGTVPDDFRLSVREIDPGWVMFRPPTVFLQPGDQATAAIVINPPVGIPAGSLRPIFRLLSRRAGNVAIVEIAMPLAPAAAPPPYQPPSRQQTPPTAAPHTPPPPARQAPPPPPAPAATTQPIPKPIAQTPITEAVTEAAAPVAAAHQLPRDVTPDRPEQRRNEPMSEQMSRPGISPLILGVGSVLVVLLLIVAGIALSRRAGTTNETEPTAVVSIAATEAPAVNTATTVIAAPSTVPATATVAFVAKTFIVANTGGDGVYLRRTTNLEDRDTPYVDGTALVQLGPDVQANGTTWRYVRTPDGKTGYVPAQYTQQAP